MEQSTYALTFWQRIAYGLAFTLIYSVSLLPFWLLYRLSDLIFVLTYYIIGYRRAIVRKNLRDSFPEKDEKELSEIEQAFYRWFGDYIVETLKLFSMSKKSMCKHMTFRNVEMAEQLVAKGQGVALYLGHYCNWEWISSIPQWLKGNYAGAQVYHVLESHVMDKLLLYSRHRMGTENVKIMDVLRYIVDNRKAGLPVVMGFIGDQVPFWNNIGHWMTFLSHPDTPVLTGTERIARKYNMACVYIDVRRLRRGYYEAEFQLMTDTPKEQPDKSITEDYFQRLELSIRRQPSYWLWTHNRWKRTREEYDKMIDPATGKLRF